MRVLGLLQLLHAIKTLFIKKAATHNLLRCGNPADAVHMHAAGCLHLCLHHNGMCLPVLPS